MKKVLLFAALVTLLGARAIANGAAPVPPTPKPGSPGTTCTLWQIVTHQCPK